MISSLLSVPYTAVVCKFLCFMPGDWWRDYSYFLWHLSLVHRASLSVGSRDWGAFVIWVTHFFNNTRPNVERQMHYGTSACQATTLWTALVLNIQGPILFVTYTFLTWYNFFIFLVVALKSSAFCRTVLTHIRLHFFIASKSVQVAYVNGIGWATWAVWVEIKRYSLSLTITIIWPTPLIWQSCTI